MPAHNFMLDDVAGCLCAICLFPLFLLIPGYAAAWTLDLFDFRRRTEVFRMALSVPLSIALCPILTFLAGRAGSWPAIFALYVAAAAAFLWILGRRARSWWKNGRPIAIRPWAVFIAIAAVWLVVAVSSLVDLQIGDRLYYPTSALDNSVRAAFVHSVETTGIPPQNPFFSPGPPVALRYHYFWVMMCSLVERVAPRLANSRQALIGGTFWCGVGLMSLVALYLRLFSGGDPRRFRRRALTGILLLGITGLDILPTFFLILLYCQGSLTFMLPSVEWWNEHVDWFLYSALWAPHALASLLAAMTGFLLLWQAPAVAGRGRYLRYAVPGAIALASSIGASIYVSFVFAVFLAVWTGITIWKRWRQETKVLLTAGTLCALLALPYLAALRGPAAANASEGFPLQLTVRTFSLAALVPTWGLTQGWRLLLVNGPLLPLNYLLEFGFFFLIAHLHWRKHRTSGRPLSRAELASAAMVITSTLICTFLRSSVIGCNDLGWRGFLVAQFMLVIWAADLWVDAPGWLARYKAPLTLCLILGAAGVVYDLAITRLYPVLADRGVVPALDWMGPDRQIGRRTFAARQAYEWADRATPETASIQFNPRVVFQETTALLYSDRRMVAGGPTCVSGFGGDPALCTPIVSRLDEFYKAATASDVGIAEVCANLPIDLLVAKDTDAVWHDRASWVWTERPAFANSYMRLFRCRDASRAALNRRAPVPSGR
jgi:hypothetical protein